MKFMLGFITGVAVGGYVASTMTDEQRARAVESANATSARVKDSRVVSSITDNVGKVGDATTERVTDAVDAAGDAAAGAVATDVPSTNSR